jgi:hypothetical protein
LSLVWLGLTSRAFVKAKHLATLITVASLAMAGVHVKWPNLKIDAITLGLLAFALVPWLRSGFASSPEAPPSSLQVARFTRMWSFSCGSWPSWIALRFVAIGTLSALAMRDWQSLVVLWTSISAAFLFIELREAGPELAWWNALKERITPRPKYHVVPKTGPRRPAESDDVYSSIDPILDKISKFGIGV